MNLLELNKLIENKKSGIYNVVSNEMLSNTIWNNASHLLRLTKGLVKKSSLRKREDLVRRPLNMSLSCKKVEKELNLKILPLKEQIKFCKTLMISTIKKVQKILTKEHKSKYYLLIFLIIVGMLLEILGIGLIIPFLENITKNNSSSFTFFNPILLSLGIEIRISQSFSLHQFYFWFF